MKDLELEPVVDNAARRRRAFRVAIYLVAGFLIQGFGCDGSGCAGPGCDRKDSLPQTPPVVYLSYESTAGQWPLRVTTAGDTFTVPIAVWSRAGETPGTQVVVTLTADGATVNPPTRTVILAPQDQATYTTFQATVSDNPPDAILFNVRKGNFTAARQLTNVPNLVSVTLTPAQHDVPRGQSRNFTIGVLPLGNTEGTVSLDMRHSSAVSGNIVFAPTPVVVNLTRGATVPIEQTIAAVVSDQTPLEIFEVTARQANRVRATARIRVVAATGGTPTFTFTANPTTLSAPIYQETIPVTFTLSPVDGFSGDVVVSQTADGEVGINPTVDDETFTVAPGTPTTFTRRFTRLYGEDTIRVTFTATHQASTTTRQVVINLTP